MSPGGENIGGMNVSIDADYSPLAAAYSTAQSMSQTAGTDIANALADGAAAGADVGQQIADSLTPITPAADDAATAIGGMGNAAGGAAAPIAEMGSTSEESASKLSGMVAQLTAVGSALAVTDGLREFGLAALEASDNITLASIALTTLTGSADAAEGTIQGLETLGMQDGLAMPPLLTAAQRMTALLPAGTNVVSVLGEVADGAAVMGTNIDQAATMFDRLISQGTASARTLTSLGISLNSLSDALNVVAGGSVSTATDVAAMFKGLDDQGRIAVLEQALSKLGGTAQQVAEQTFGGQWQQLANAWEQVMVQVGQALTPVISELVEFTKTDIVPVIQGLVSGFNSLSEPMKEVGVGAAVLVAALVPITGIVAAGAIAFNSITEAAKALGLISATAAGQETAHAAAIAASGGAAAASIPEIEAATGAVEESGAAADEAAIQYDLFAHSALSAEWGAGAEQLSLFAGSEVAAGEGAATMGASMSLAAISGVLVLAGALGSLVGAYEAWKNSGEQQAQTNAQLMSTVDALTTALQKHGIEFQDIVDQYNNGKITLQQLVAGLQDLDTQYQNSVTSLQNASNNSILLSGALKTLTDSTTKQENAYKDSLAVYQAVINSLQTGLPLYKDHVATIDDLTAAETSLVSAAGAVPAGIAAASTALAADSLAAEKAALQYQSTEGAYQQLLQGAQAGTATWGQVEAAYTKVQAAEATMASAGTPVAGTLQAITQAANQSVDSLTNLASSEQLASDQTTAQSDNLTSLSAAAIVADQKLDLLVQEQAKLQSQVASGVATQQQLNTLLGQVATAATQAEAAEDKLQTATLNQGNAAAIAGGDVGVLKQQLDAANLNLDQMTQKADAGQISITAWAGAEKAATTAAVNFAVGVAEANADVTGSTDAVSLAAVAYAGAQAKLQALTQAFLDHKAAASDVASATKSALSAQIAFDQEQAVAASGIGTSTNALDLLNIAVIEAKAKVDDLSTAQQNGANVADQLLAAQNSLKSAQDALNTAQGSGISLADQLGAADGQVATAANTATGALNAQAAAATAAASAMGSLSAADAAAAAASDNASTTSGMLADNPGGIASIGVGSAPSGYVLQSGSLAGHESVNAVLAPGYTTDYAGSGATGSWFWSTFLPTAVTFAQALQLNVAAAEKAAAAQYSGTDPFSLDEATLASAQADLQTLTKSYTAGNQAGITPAQIQSAQTAVATAQAALNALSGTSATTTTSTSTSGGTSTASSLAQALQALQVADAEYNAAEASGNAGAIATAQAAVDAANTAYVNAGGYTGPGAGTSTGATGVDNPLLPQPASVGTTDTTGTTTTSTTGTTGTTATTSVGSTTSGGTAANDGGSYPAVTAHQSSAEVWNVAMGTATSDTTSATSSAVTAAASSTDAATASQAASTAASSAVNATGYIASTLATTADTLAATIAGLDTIAANTNPKGSATPINLSTGAVTGSLPTSQALPTSQVGGTESGSIGGALNYWTPPPVTTVGAPLTAADITALIAQGEADFISNFGQGVGSVGEQSQLGYLSSLGVSMTQLQALVVQAQNSYAQQQSAISAQLQIVENQYINAVEGGASPAAIAALAAQLQTQYGMSQGQIGALVPPSNAPTPGAAVYPGSVAPSMAGGGMNVHIDFTGANFSGANPATISNAVQAGMQQALVNTLRAQGARF
jgi:hypothetical protein